MLTKQKITCKAKKMLDKLEELALQVSYLITFKGCPEVFPVF